MLESIGDFITRGAKALGGAVGKLSDRETLRSLGELMMLAGAELGNPPNQNLAASIIQQKAKERQERRTQEELAQALSQLAAGQGIQLSPEQAKPMVQLLGPAAAKFVMPDIASLGSTLVRVPPPLQPQGQVQPLYQVPQKPQLPPGEVGALATSLAMQEAAKQQQPFRPEMAWAMVPQAMAERSKQRVLERMLSRAPEKPKPTFLDKPAIEAQQAGRVWVAPNGHRVVDTTILAQNTVGDMLRNGYNLLRVQDAKSLEASFRALAMINQVARAVAIAELSGRLVPMQSPDPNQIGAVDHAARAAKRWQLWALSEFGQDPVLRLLQSAHSEMVGLARNVYDEVGFRALGAVQGLMDALKPGNGDYVSLWLILRNLDQIARENAMRIIGPGSTSQFPGAAWLPSPEEVQTTEGKEKLRALVQQLHQRMYFDQFEQEIAGAAPTTAKQLDAIVNSWAGQTSSQPATSPAPQPQVTPTPQAGGSTGQQTDALRDQIRALVLEQLKQRQQGQQGR